MKFPRYWARGECQGRTPDGRAIDVCAFGWSSVSLEDARRVGEERARRAAERMHSGQYERRWAGRAPDSNAQYGYQDIPPREEILETIEVGGREIGLLTRNAYGALVLNTDCVLFVDIDLPAGEAAKSAKPAGGGLFGLFARKPAAPSPPAAPDPAEAAIAGWSARNRAAAFRLYRTCAGWRLLFTDALYDPTSEPVRRVFSELGADPLYVRLTERQECFRARLTPKPWRIRAFGPPYGCRYPFANAQAERRMREWEAAYVQKTQGHTTCLAPRNFGSQTAMLPEIRRIVELHDRLACAGGERLA
jgi:hypothetical protein